MQKGQLEEEKEFKIMQLSIAERQFKAESEREEREIGMQKEQCEEEKEFKFMQLCIEEHKFKVESEKEKRKIGML